VREISSPVAATGEGIVDAFARLVEQRSTEGMVVSPGRRSTFGDVDTLAQDVSDRVATVGLQRGTLVGLAAGSGPAFFAGLLALRRLGIAVLLLDPLAPVEDRRRAARSLGANAVLDCVDGWPSSGAAFHIHRIQPPVAMRSRADVAIVKLTSGSTGAPRGVAMCSEHVLADEAALAHTMGLRATDRLLAAIPLSHSYGFTTLALSALVRGLTLVVPADRGPFSSLAAADPASDRVPDYSCLYSGAAETHPPTFLAREHTARDLGRRLSPECHGGEVQRGVRAAGARVLRGQ